MPNIKNQRPQSAQSLLREKSILRFLEEFAPSPHHDLLTDVLVTATRLAKDQAGRGELKIIRTALKEMRYAFKVFAPYHEIPKVTVFGSARTPLDHADYHQARAFAEKIEQAGWMVITGAGDGIMRAGHHGAKREKSFGVAISLPFEQKTNDIIGNDPKLILFKYFFTRKLIFIKEAHAVAVFPGGFGTLDETFEAMTLIQTGKAPIIPIVLCDPPGGDYWVHWREWVERDLMKRNMVNPEDMNLFKITDDADEAVKEILHFYHRYHSSRMVHDQLVIRLKSPLSDSAVDRLNRQFKDLVIEGQMQTSGALPEEGTEYADLPRLIFQFNRRSYGRLRLLINEINQA